MCALAGAAHADTFHVAATGDDAAPGTAAQPWATLQHAAEQVVAGDRVVVHGGTYRGFELRHRGKPDAPIAFAAAPGETVSIAGDNPNTPDGICLEGVAYVELGGFSIAAPSRDGVRISHGNAITVRGIRVANAGVNGIEAVASDDITIDGAVISGAQRSHGIAITGGTRPHITASQISDSARDGIAIDGAAKDGGSGIVDGAVLEANRIWSSGGAGISLDGAPRATVASCLLWGNAAAGVIVRRQSGARPSAFVRIVNNTIVAPVGAWALRLRDGSTNATIRNNILQSADANTGAIDINASCLPLDSDHNAVTPRFTLDGTTLLDLPRWQMQSRHDVASIAPAASLFVDPSRGDFTLRPGSAAIDAGDDASAPSRDLAGHRRVVGKHVDLGAIELCSGAACEPTSFAAVAPRSGCCDGSGGGGLAPLIGLLALRRRRPR